MRRPPSLLKALVVFAALAVPAASHGQTSGAAPWGLFSARYDTQTSDFIYAAYGYGRGFGMVGALQNPRSGYTELVAALGTTFSIAGGPTHSLAVGGARVANAWYGQVYYLPVEHRAPFWFRATAELYVPLRGSHSTQFALSPASVTVSISRWFEVGAALDLASATGDKTGTAVGPEFRFALPNAVLGVDVQHSLNERTDRLRLFFTTAF